MKPGIADITHVHANNKPAERNGLPKQLSKAHAAVATAPVTTIGDKRNTKARSAFSNFVLYFQMFRAR